MEELLNYYYCDAVRQAETREEELKLLTQKVAQRQASKKTNNNEKNN